MKYLFVIPLAVFSLAIQAQTANTQGVTGTRVDVELTKRIDVKKAKVGDVVEARTTAVVKFADGAELPKGTKVVGKVTDARAKSKADGSSHLAFNLNQAVTKDGHELSFKAMVISVTAEADTPPDTSAIAGGSRGGASTAQNPNAAIKSPSNPSGAYVTQGAISDGMHHDGDLGPVARGPNDRVPVTNMPGVVLTSADGTNNAGVLDAANQNISLDSGTKLILRVIPQK
ncbi:hypothetical protein [Granulicella sp. S190]|uniref:hypothetical protein n=1 Tax=Granulicella sp. S190 TaxID=1747226 RepID=UPI00131DE84E|nr:hypothetical protein [Granulicella sp. S190]